MESTNKRQISVIADLNGHHVGAITDALNFPEEGAIISAGDDKQILIWLKRDDSTYWPSIHQHMPSGITKICFKEESRTLFIGQENGSITEFTVSQDFNVMTQIKSYPAHSSSITEITCDEQSQYLLSCSQDKTITLSSTLGNGKRLCCTTLLAPCMCMIYDPLSRTVFTGTFDGDISIHRIENNRFIKVTSPLSGHTGSVRSLAWCPSKKWLFSGSFDKSVALWDIGGGKGEYFQLNCHMSTVTSLVHLPEHEKLLSISIDGIVVVWDLKVSRKPMWRRKTLSGRRQHHCRICGKAVCAECSSGQSTYPLMGYENPVRICTSCAPDVESSDRTPLVKRFLIPGKSSSLFFNHKNHILVAGYKDGNIKLLDLRSIISPGGTELPADSVKGTFQNSGSQLISSVKRSQQSVPREKRATGETSVIDLSKRTLSDDEQDDEDVIQHQLKLVHGAQCVAQ
eukprot:gene1295-4500_t